MGLDRDTARSGWTRLGRAGKSGTAGWQTWGRSGKGL